LEIFVDQGIVDVLGLPVAIYENGDGICGGDSGASLTSSSYS
jgi:hypothetical protein